MSDRASNGQLLFGGRELFEGETSVLPVIGPIAQFIDALPFNNFAQLMINLSKREQAQKDKTDSATQRPAH